MSTKDALSCGKFPGVRDITSIECRKEIDCEDEVFAVKGGVIRRVCVSFYSVISLHQVILIIHTINVTIDYIFAFTAIDFV